MSVGLQNRCMVIVLLTAHASLLGYAASCHGPVVDETPHLVSGLSHYDLGRFDLFCANPPVVRMMAAAPLALVGTETDWTNYDDAPGARAEFDVARDFARLHGMGSFHLHTIARWACLPLSVLGGLVCWRWGRALYGDAAGIVALALWCFCPNILANAHLIIPDLGATALGLLAMYSFWLWLRDPRWELALFAGAALGLAELTKFTWVILFGLWPLLWCVWRPARSSAFQLMAILVLSLVVINAGYAFEGSFERLGSYRFVSRTLKSPDDPMTTSGNRFAGTWLGHLPVPLPQNYLAGIDSVKIAFESNRLAYLGGEFRSGGWWYYYLYALALKVPLGLGVLIVLTLGITARRLVSWRDTLVLLSPLVVLLVFVSANSGINRHLRYVLPTFPFAFIWVSQVVRGVSSGPIWIRRGFAMTVPLAVTWFVVASLSVFPHSGSYFNELAGGPRRGSEHLVCSNIDWGQDLLFLKRWYQSHPEARPFRLAYYGAVDPAIAGFEFSAPPIGPHPDGRLPELNYEKMGPVPGWHAISVHILAGSPSVIADGTGKRKQLDVHDYSYFRKFEPISMAGYSIAIYHLSVEEVERRRRELGLPPWSECLPDLSRTSQTATTGDDS